MVSPASPDPGPLLRRLGQLGASGLRARCRRWPAAEIAPLHGYTVVVGARGRGSGRDLSSPVVAAERALGEAVERHVALERALPASRIRIATPAELNGEALPLDTIAGYAAELRRADPVRLAWSSQTEFAWLQAQALAAGTEHWIPLQLVARTAASCESWVEPEIAPRVTTGLAAHPDRPTAILHGLLEVVERDAFIRAWLTGTALDVLDLAGASDPPLAGFVRALEATGAQLHAGCLPTDAPVAAVFAVVRNPSGPDVAAGAGAHPTLAGAAVRALTEAFAVSRWLAHNLDGGGEPEPDDPATIGRQGRLRWWARRGRWPLLAPFFSGRRIRVEDVADAPLDSRRELDRLLAWFAGAGEPVFLVELTDPALASDLGHHVVRVVVPGFHPMHLDEARPALWSRRLVRTADLNRLPHPVS